MQMKAIILAGGYGTRLWPLTLRIPKAMVPVGGVPVVQHSIKALKNAGITDIIFSLNTNQKSVEDYFENGSKFGVNITYVYEDTQNDSDKFGAIGAIEFALEKTGGPQDCIVINGDNVFYGLDLLKMIEHHQVSKSQATLALYALTNKSDVTQYGVMQLDDEKKLITFQEKPKENEAKSNLASAGIYILGKVFLAEHLSQYIKNQKSSEKKPDRVGDLWAHYVGKLPIYGHPLEGMWGDTNTAQTYIQAHKQAMNFVVNPKDSKNIQNGLVQNSHKTIISENAKISELANIKGPCIIEDGCIIEEGAIIGPNTHLMKNVVVGTNSSVTGSIIFEQTVIGSKCSITDCIVDKESIISENSQIDPYSIIGTNCKLEKEVRITNNSRIWPKIRLGSKTIIAGEVILEN